MISVNVRCMYGSIMFPRICLYIQLKITGVECHLISHYQVYLSIHCHWTRYNILSQTLIWIVLFKLINLKFNYVIRQYQRKKKKAQSTQQDYDMKTKILLRQYLVDSKRNAAEVNRAIIMPNAFAYTLHTDTVKHPLMIDTFGLWWSRFAFAVKKSTNFALADILCGWSTMNANFHFIFFLSLLFALINNNSWFSDFSMAYCSERRIWQSAGHRNEHY